MDRKHIRKLYKYLPFSANSISILINKKIWYALPNSLNDPFDCQMVEYSIDADAIKKERITEYDRVYKEKSNSGKFGEKLHKLFKSTLTKSSRKERQFYETLEKVQFEQQALVNQFGILSLSATAKNILMWSHYAQNHTGFCIEFIRNENNALGADAVPVIYCKSRTGGDEDTEEGGIFARKHTGWRYEKEWRIVQLPGDSLHPIPGNISSVIVGSKMEESSLETIKNILGQHNSNESSRRKHIRLKYAEMDPEDYKINIREI